MLTILFIFIFEMQDYATRRMSPIPSQNPFFQKKGPLNMMP